MATLESYGKEIHSIFQLLGDKENDITLSTSWALAKCSEFLKALIISITGIAPPNDDISILNQRYDANAGITDIEITNFQTFHIIIEAKRGWILPSADQLTKYSLRSDFQNAPYGNKYIVTMSECTQSYATAHLPFREINKIPVKHLSYREVYQLAKTVRSVSNNEQKHLLDEFCEYLKGLMTMQKLDSNMVYVVALGTKTPDRCSLTWIDIVQKYNKYFCPVGGNGWPKEPPNYIAFRYYGQLQAIHHIDGYTVTRNLHDEIPEMPDEVCDTNHYVYKLGPAIKPVKTVKTGKIFRNGRVWAMLDTLLICDTISDARDLTQSRLE